jgi:hypothetical protein
LIGKEGKTLAEWARLTDVIALRLDNGEGAKWYKLTRHEPGSAS